MKPVVNYNDIQRQLLIRNRFIDTSVLYRKAAALAVDGYRDQDLYSEDYGLVLRLGRSGKLANLAKVMVQYRINPGGVTQTKVKQRIRTALRLIKENKAYYPNYGLAWAQWQLQNFLVRLGTIKLLNFLKNIFYRIPHAP